MVSTRRIPRLEQLTVRNYRALYRLELKGLSPLTALLGPNGSGKSTVFDVFAFLSECLDDGLRRAWDKRGRFKELRTRGVAEPITIELKYREPEFGRLITYHLEIDESGNSPIVSTEWLRWVVGQGGHRPTYILRFAKGEGEVISGPEPDEAGERTREKLDSPDLLAVNTLGQFARNPRVASLRRFITDWHLSYLSAETTRTTPVAGPQERLSSTGDNLPNVVQYLQEQHPERLAQIGEVLARRVPRLEAITAEPMRDGRLLLQIKDAPFDDPIMARFTSDGTLKMLSYLVLLYDPTPPQLIGIEEPENQLHPRLLLELAEECSLAAERSQLMITTHSPFFVNGLQPEQVWVLYRDEQGYTRAQRTSQIRGVREFMAAGAQLGFLWMEGHFGVGDPLNNPGQLDRRLGG